MEWLFNRIHIRGMSLDEHAFKILEKNICELHGRVNLCMSQLYSWLGYLVLHNMLLGWDETK